MNHRRTVPFCALLLALLPAAAQAQGSGVTIELEAGPVWQSYNDVEIPNDGTATRFSLSDLAGTGPWAGGRLYITAPLGGRHALRLLVAPFSTVDATLKLGRDLDERWAVRAGYRMVEGGADVDEVYTFAWLHSAAVSLVLRP